MVRHAAEMHGMMYAPIACHSMGTWAQSEREKRSWGWRICHFNSSRARSHAAEEVDNAEEQPGINNNTYSGSDDEGNAR